TAVVRWNPPEPVELGWHDLGVLLSEKRMERNPALQEGEGRTVLRRDVEQPVGDHHAAGAGHVLGYDRGLAWNVLAQILGKGTGVGIITAARRRTDQHADGLALVEIGRASHRCSRCEDRE